MEGILIRFFETLFFLATIVWRLFTLEIVHLGKMAVPFNSGCLREHLLNIPCRSLREGSPHNSNLPVLWTILFLIGHF